MRIITLEDATDSAWHNTPAQCTPAVRRHCFTWQDLSERIHQNRKIIRKDTTFADTFLVKLVDSLLRRDYFILAI